MSEATISKLPTHQGDGYSWGGGYVVNCPIVYRDGTGPKEISLNSICLLVGDDLGPNNGSGAPLTAQFIADAVNEKIEREFKP